MIKDVLHINLTLFWTIRGANVPLILLFAWLRWSYWLTCWKRKSGHEGVLTTSRLQWMRSLQHATTSHTAAGWTGWWRRCIPDREWGRATAQALMVPSTAAVLSTSPPHPHPPAFFQHFQLLQAREQVAGWNKHPWHEQVRCEDSVSREIPCVLKHLCSCWISFSNYIGI